MSVLSATINAMSLFVRDMEWFMGLLGEKLGLHFDQTFHGLCPSKQPPIFGMSIVQTKD